jgi:AcrR family transcriptional regulator
VERTATRVTRDAATAGPAGFPVSVLARRTGVSVPTIHHYRRLGLLPPATAVAPNRFLYGERHVAALTIIRLLRDRQHLPLETVRELLPDLLSGSPQDLAPDAWDALLASRLSDTATGQPRERLLAVARVAFARRGYDGASVGEICDAAGIAKGSFYRYFDSKDDIFVAAASSTVDAVGQALDQQPGSLSEAQAVGALRSLLEPLAPLLLEAATRELRSEAAAAGVVAGVAQGLAARVLPRLAARGARAIPAARRVVDTVLVSLVRPALGLRSPTY